MGFLTIVWKGEDFTDTDTEYSGIERYSWLETFLELPTTAQKIPINFSAIFLLPFEYYKPQQRLRLMQPAKNTITPKL